MQWLAVALGGAVGAVSRYGIAYFFPPIVNNFPWATWIANLAGSLVMGVCYVLIVDKGLVSEEWRLLVMVGFLGALTTFSTFALETILLWQHQQLQQAIIYFSTSTIGCLLCVAASIWLTQRLF